MARSPESVAVLGIGAMGHGMASSALRSGIPTIVWNRTPEAARDLAKLGAEAVETPADAARRAGIVITMVTDTQAVFSIARDQGMLAALAPGAIWAQMSTIGTRGIERVAAMVELERPDVLLIDAPVSGSKEPAERGELTIFASGPGRSSIAYHSTLRRARPAHALGGADRVRIATEAGEQHMAGICGRSGCHINGPCPPVGA